MGSFLYVLSSEFRSEKRVVRNVHPCLKELRRSRISADGPAICSNEPNHFFSYGRSTKFDHRRLRFRLSALDSTLTLFRFSGKYFRNHFAAIFRIYLQMNELGSGVIKQGSLRRRDE